MEAMLFSATSSKAAQSQSAAVSAKLINLVKANKALYCKAVIISAMVELLLEDFSITQQQALVIATKAYASA